MAASALTPRSTAGARVRCDAAVCAGDDPRSSSRGLAAGFLGGLNVTTLARSSCTSTGTLLRSAPPVASRRLHPSMVRTKFIDETCSVRWPRRSDRADPAGGRVRLACVPTRGGVRGVSCDQVDDIRASHGIRARPALPALGRARASPSSATSARRPRQPPSLHERSARTLFVWSGVSFYLPDQAVRGGLSWVAAHSVPARRSCSTRSGRRQSTGHASTTAHASCAGQPRQEASRFAGAYPKFVSMRRCRASDCGPSERSPARKAMPST